MTPHREFNGHIPYLAADNFLLGSPACSPSVCLLACRSVTLHVYSVSTDSTDVESLHLWSHCRRGLPANGRYSVIAE
jgi:hypothetical protein